MPSLFYFSLSGPDSLCTPPYNQIVQFLSGKPIRVFSMNLPAHEIGLSPDEAVHIWAEEMARGERPRGRFLEQAQMAIGYAFKEKLILPGKLAAAGLSRGALFAALSAAQDDRVRPFWDLRRSPVCPFLTISRRSAICPSWKNMTSASMATNLRRSGSAFILVTTISASAPAPVLNVWKRSSLRPRKEDSLASDRAQHLPVDRPPWPRHPDRNFPARRGMDIDAVILAAEPSGDLHGAALLEALLSKNPNLKIAAVAGPRMRQFPIFPIGRMEELQVMGFTDVVAALPRLYFVFRRLRNAILRLNPKTVVFIDYPGFHLRLERSLRRHGYRGRLIHTICPTVWAYGKGRIATMAQNLDLL